MYHWSFLLALCCLIAGQSSAQPIYNDTVTSVSGRVEISTENPGFWNLSFSGSGFQLGGNGGDALGNPILAGQPIPLEMSFNLYSGGVNVGGMVNFGGITISAYVDGSAQIFSSSTFVLPSNPAATYTFPAQMTGQFIARPDACGPLYPSLPPCGTEAVLSLNLPMELTVHVSFIAPNPDRAYVYETFESVPEPSSVGLWLFGTGCFGIAWLARRRKARTLPC